MRLTIFRVSQQDLQFAGSIPIIQYSNTTPNIAGGYLHYQANASLVCNLFVNEMRRTEFLLDPVSKLPINKRSRGNHVIGSADA
jgi:hypothetical protein